MSRINSFGVNESIVHAKDTNYGYRRGMGMFPSTEWHVVFDDFATVTSSNAPTGWTAIIDTGATAVSADTQGGGIVVASDAVSEGVGLYLPKSIQLGGNKFFMEVRFKTDDADDTDVQFGLSDLSVTTDPEDLWDTSNADGIAAGVLDGDASPVLVYDKDNGGPVTETASGTTYDLSDDTFHILAIVYGGSSTPQDSELQLWVDGQLAASAATEAQVPEDVVLAPFIGARTGGDAGHTITFDYFRFAVAR